MMGSQDKSYAQALSHQWPLTILALCPDGIDSEMESRHLGLSPGSAANSIWDFGPLCSRWLKKKKKVWTRCLWALTATWLLFKAHSLVPYCVPGSELKDPTMLKGILQHRVLGAHRAATWSVSRRTSWRRWCLSLFSQDEKQLGS